MILSKTCGAWFRSIIGAAMMLCGSLAVAANFSALYTLQLDPSQFVRSSFCPGIDLSSLVYHSNMRFTVKLMDDGSLTYLGDTRTELINLSTGQTSAISASVGMIWKTAGKLGAKLADVTLGRDITSQFTTSRSGTSSQEWAKKNAIELKVENNLVSALVTYMSGTVQCTTEIILGWIDDAGMFRPFDTGPLAGIPFIANPPGFLDAIISPENPPAARNPLLRQYGVVKSTGRLQLVWVLTGWIQWVASQGGRIIAVWYEPWYEERLVAYSPFGLETTEAMAGRMDR
ncbi:MAG: hypothetical protein QM691_10920 [Opitutaceae bacterium]